MNNKSNYLNTNRSVSVLSYVCILVLSSRNFCDNIIDTPLHLLELY